ncbi:MAG: hypothetical protein R3A78_00595 [Polyangiales bacterium]
MHTVDDDTVVVPAHLADGALDDARTEVLPRLFLRRIQDLGDLGCGATRP